MASNIVLGSQTLFRGEISVCDAKGLLFSQVIS